MKVLTEGDFLPEEYFSQKKSMTEDVRFDRTLIMDLVSCQHPVAIVSIDAVKCYTRVNHSIMSLTWLALINHLGVIV